VPLVVPPRVVPRLGAEYFDVGLEETVLGGWSTKEVSVVLGESQLEEPGWRAQLLRQGFRKVIRVGVLLTGRSCRHLPAGVVHFLPLCRVRQ
jgi:hypothetical protein